MIDPARGSMIEFLIFALYKASRAKIHFYRTIEEFREISILSTAGKP